jgi:GntR family transcriptional regulator/MocR family aminotransferase
MSRPPSAPGRSIYDDLRGRILRNSLPAGTRLPSSRDLAAQRGVARMTVVKAYGRLVDEGYAQSRPGAGTFVAPVVPDRLLAVRRRGAEIAPVRSDPPSVPAAAVRPFAPHLPALDAFPYALWARLVGRAARGLHGSALAYQDPQGHPGLREAIALHWNATRGASLDASRVIVTAGAQNALDLLARGLCRAGDLVAMEAPGYPLARAAFRNAGLEVADVPVDDEGLVVDALDRLPRAPRLVYVTPAHQQPTGVALTMRRRLALLDHARRHGSTIVEDDYDSEFRYAGRPLPVLQSLDPQGRVVLVSSFSKTLFPALRVGFIHAPSDADVSRLVRLQDESLRSVAALEQHAVALFMQDGWYARHLRSMRREYAQRRAHLKDLLEGPAAGAVREALTLQWPHTGFCALGHLRRADRSVGDLSRAAAARGLELLAFRTKPTGRAGVMLGFGCMPIATMPRAVAVLNSLF